jgi:hypothetical protein
VPPLQPAPPRAAPQPPVHPPLLQHAGHCAAELHALQHLRWQAF